VLAENSFFYILAAFAGHKPFLKFTPRISHRGIDSLGAGNLCFDLLQFMLNLGQIGLHHNTLLNCKLRAGFEPRIRRSSASRSIIHQRKTTREGASEAKNSLSSPIPVVYLDRIFQSWRPRLANCSHPVRGSSIEWNLSSCRKIKPSPYSTFNDTPTESVYRIKIAHTAGQYCSPEPKSTTIEAKAL
jgi:hypothetical protein